MAGFSSVNPVNSFETNHVQQLEISNNEGSSMLHLHSLEMNGESEVISEDYKLIIRIRVGSDGNGGFYCEIQITKD